MGLKDLIHKPNFMLSDEDKLIGKAKKRASFKNLNSRRFSFPFKKVSWMPGSSKTQQSEYFDDYLDNHSSTLSPSSGKAFSFDESTYMINRNKDMHARVENQLLTHGSNGESSRKKNAGYPRVTSYCLANSYNIREIQKMFNRRIGNHKTGEKKSKIYDECTVDVNERTELLENRAESEYSLDDENRNRGGILGVIDRIAFNSKDIIPEAFVFDYGVVVTWGMTEIEEQAFLREISIFSLEPISYHNQQKDEFGFTYDKAEEIEGIENCIIRNDLITLDHDRSSATKLAISHAIAQSGKISLYEDLFEVTINQTKRIPQSLAKHGHVNMSRTSIAKKIGQLFIMRVNVSLISNILDTPEIFWYEPDLQPIYNEVRNYLEISQRIDLLNHRVGVIGNMLEMLRTHINGSHGVSIMVMSTELYVFSLLG
ncbi:Sporulation protein RMD1 [Smittium culicis]|uniref:Sporulation protein RMD1 n=1 Tax=Smittium culicis TaxID=133412 RepID=A0A1R1XWJ5_9FUNG|nr:Sporulation protein RMD1 [Smittium culicis]OMJ18958.1 Sporulation protein RMD1 [Smittium culicis]